MSDTSSNLVYLHRPDEDDDNFDDDNDPRYEMMALNCFSKFFTYRNANEVSHSCLF